MNRTDQTDQTDGAESRACGSGPSNLSDLTSPSIAFIQKVAGPAGTVAQAFESGEVAATRYYFKIDSIVSSTDAPTCGAGVTSTVGVGVTSTVGADLTSTVGVG